MAEKLIRVGHLRRYLKEPTRGTTAAPAADKAIADIEHASEPRPTINFILGGPADSKYQSKKQRRRMLRVTSVRARVNTVRDRGDITAVLPVDDPISFPPINLTRVITPHYDALVLTVCINSFNVHRVLVDPGSVTDLLHLPAFKYMRVPIDHLHSTGRVLSGFNGATTLSVGDITFSVKAGPVTQQVLFSVVEDLGPYNAILGRSWLHAMKAVPSTYHQTISYMTEFGQVDLQGSQLAVWQCYQLSLQGREQSECSGEPPLEDQPSQYQSQSSFWPASEDRESLAIDPLETTSLDGPDICIYISTLLSEEEKAQLRQVIQLNANVFAWTHVDMTEISPTHASHMLNVAPFAKPVRQKMRRFHPDCHLVIQTKVDNLL